MSLSESEEYSDSGSGGVTEKFALHNAAEQGDEAAIKKLLFLASEDGTVHVNPAIKLSFNAKDVIGCNPLHTALLYGSVGCATHLLAAGMDPNIRCDGNPPLHLAACLAMHKGKAEHAVQLMQLLLKHGAQCLDTDDCGRTALHWVAVLDLAGIVKQLVTLATEEQERQIAAYKAAAVADPELNLPESVDHLVDMQDNDGNTAIALAARHGSVEVLRMLLAANQAWSPVGLIKVRNKDGFAPLHLATLHNQPAAVQLIVSAGNAGLRLYHDRKGRTPAQLAALRGLKDVLAILDPAHAKSDKQASAQDSQPAAVPCILIAPEECHLHRTAPEPYRRGMPAPPPENIHRLRVLTTPGFGVLTGREFSNLPWRTSGVPCAAMTDVLRCHEWAYLRQLSTDCNTVQDTLDAIGHLDSDTAICHQSYFAALKAAGACIQAVDDIMEGKARTAFCAVRPPGHHAGPLGVVRNANDHHGSHGFCLLSNVAIAAGYAMSTYRHKGIKRVAILDFDVHHGNGTEAVVANVVPSVRKVTFHTPFADGQQIFPTFKPWLDTTDKDNILFASVQGYGRHPFSSSSWFYPGSGATSDTQPPMPPMPPPPSTALANTLPHPDRVGATAAAAGNGVGTSAAGAVPVDGSVGAGARSQEEGMLFPEDPDHEFLGNTVDKGGAVKGRQSEGPRIINVGVPGPGAKRQLWRRAWRDKILPAVANFRPDMIFVSAGFDAHKKESLNLKYVGITEAEYEWITDQIKQLANRFAQGRIVSVLEGGYNLNGGACSALARSVAAHVRVLAETHSQIWDSTESQAERQAEARKREAAAAAHAAAVAAAEAAAAVKAAEAAEQAAAAAAEAVVTAPESGAVPMAVDEVPVAVKAEAGREAVPSSQGLVGLGSGEPESSGGGRAKRARRGEPVDYVALNAKMQAEKEAGASTSQQQQR